MAKSKSKRKQIVAGADLQIAKKLKTSTTITPPPEHESNEPKTIKNVGLEEDDLDLAVDTLNTLTSHPAVIKSKACKDLRTAVYEFRQACTTGFNASGRLSDCQWLRRQKLTATSRYQSYGSNKRCFGRWRVHAGANPASRNAHTRTNTEAGIVM